MKKGGGGLNFRYADSIIVFAMVRKSSNIVRYASNSSTGSKTSYIHYFQIRNCESNDTFKILASGVKSLLVATPPPPLPPNG